MSFKCMFRQGLLFLLTRKLVICNSYSGQNMLFSTFKCIRHKLLRVTKLVQWYMRTHFLRRRPSPELLVLHVRFDFSFYTFDLLSRTIHSLFSSIRYILRSKEKVSEGIRTLDPWSDKRLC